jgi:hypothetical protein
MGKKQQIPDQPELEHLTHGILHDYVLRKYVSMAVQGSFSMTGTIFNGLTGFAPRLFL